MVLLSKSLSGGQVPSGAVLTRKWIFDKVFDRMDRAVVHGSTFSKNDLAMAAGLATLEVIESEGLMKNAEQKGARLLATFERMIGRHELVKEVRGKGLMIGVEFVEDRASNKAAPELRDRVEIASFERGLILLGAGANTIRWSPPLILTKENVDVALEIFDDAIAASLG